MERIQSLLGELAPSWRETLKAIEAWYQRTEAKILPYVPFLTYPHPSERHPISFENTSDFLFLPEVFSAKRHLFPETVSLAIVLALLGLDAFFALYALFSVPFLVFISAGVTTFYLVHMLFKLWVVSHSIGAPSIQIHPQAIASLRDEELPTYTILIPLYREERVVSQILHAMSAINYPVEKLDIIITLEEYDHPTTEAIRALNPPAHFKTLILPNVLPKTKPKALNVALRIAKGDFLVIYDAEVIPEPDQLKKAVLAFRAHPELASLQPRLDHYNADRNLITRLFNAEFSFYYDLFLPGLGKLGYPIPLSGHSTHFRRLALEAAGGWDPYNLTEDCDVGMRLWRRGFRTGALDSISYEEATTTLSSWIRQRSRWMKGFIQTSIVHLRHPLRLKNEVGGWANFLAFLVSVPGTPFLNIANAVTWLLLLFWLTTHTVFIQSIFPGPILYLSVINFVIGNFILVYLSLITLHRRGRYGLLKYGLLAPAYWLLQAIATTRAAIQLVTSPHTWEKTTHGTHLHS